MRRVFASDTGVYLAAGVLTIAVFVASVAVLSRTGYVDANSPGIVGFGIGFGMFMLVYFASMSLHRILSE